MRSPDDCDPELGVPVIRDLDGQIVDLDEWAEHLAHRTVGQLTVRLGWIVMGLVVSATVAWVTVRGDLASLHAQDRAFDANGTTQSRLTRAEVDSLRIELRYLPDLVADEVTRRLSSPTPRRRP